MSISTLIIILYDYSEHLLEPNRYPNSAAYQRYEHTYYLYQDFLQRVAIDNTFQDQITIELFNEFVEIAYLSPTIVFPEDDPPRQRTVLDGPRIKYFRTFDSLIYFCRTFV